MPDPELAKQGLLQLPVELLQLILARLLDPQSLACAIEASRTLYIIFKRNKPLIIGAVMERSVGAGILRDAKMAMGCNPPLLCTKLADQLSDLDEQMQEELDKYVVNFLRKDTETAGLGRQAWTLSDAIALSTFHAEVVLPLKDMFIQAASDLACCVMSERIKESLEVRPASYLEEERICRSLYRFELFRRLFGCFGWRSDEMIELAMMFFSGFSPCEIAQIGCIHDFLGRQITPVFNDVARHDITWGEFSVMFDVNTTDGPIQHILTLGLPVILAVARLQDASYEAREKFFNPEDNIPPENDDFLNSALTEINHRARPADDKNPYDNLLSTPSFHADADPGPETIWSLSLPQDGSSLALYEQHDWIPRRWGYVFWDHARLLDIDQRGAAVLTLPWEPAAHPFAERQTPSQEEREVSWQMRSSLYKRGARGWWAEGDESRARWPDERFFARQEQPTNDQMENIARHTPESLEDAKRYWTAELARRQ